MITPTFSPPRLRARRVAAGLTQSELAERTGLSVQSIGGYERDEITPSLRALGRLAGALGCPTDALMSRSTDLATEYWDAVLGALPPLTDAECEAVATVLRRIDTRLRQAVNTPPVARPSDMSAAAG